ncbi:MAG: hypothetical protein ACRC1R_05180 [Cetobacterium sp.]|uniref:hypothetical protein n=1 Tax=Cetobacterium sp. TaxID=2071632 RepID=UPI003F3D7050
MINSFENLKNISPLANINPQTQMSQWAINKITGIGAHEINKALQNSKILNKITTFANILKSVDIYILEENSSELEAPFKNLYKFPIVPSIINISDGVETEKIDSLIGKLNYIKNKNLREISFSSIFPGNYYDFSKDFSSFDWSCVNIIQEIIDKGKPIKLVITGLGIVLTSYITKFDKVTEGDGDISYTITFEEARDPKVLEIDVNIKSKFKPYSFIAKEDLLKR